MANSCRVSGPAAVPAALRSTGAGPVVIRIAPRGLPGHTKARRRVLSQTRPTSKREEWLPADSGAGADDGPARPHARGLSSSYGGSFDRGGHLRTLLRPAKLLTIGSRAGSCPSAVLGRRITTTPDFEKAGGRGRCGRAPVDASPFTDLPSDEGTRPLVSGQKAHGQLAFEAVGHDRSPSIREPSGWLCQNLSISRRWNRRVGPRR